MFLRTDIRDLLALLFLLGCLSACCDDMQWGVVTEMIKDGDRETQRLQACTRLYELYEKSTKDREAYEVISKKDGKFILHYTPVLNFLTVSGDPGSGWSRQYQNFDETTLKILVDEKFSIDDLEGYGSRSSEIDSILTIKQPIYNVNTNGDLN